MDPPGQWGDTVNAGLVCMFTVDCSDLGSSQSIDFIFHPHNQNFPLNVFFFYWNEFIWGQKWQRKSWNKNCSINKIIHEVKIRNKARNTCKSVHSNMVRGTLFCDNSLSSGCIDQHLKGLFVYSKIFMPFSRLLLMSKQR